MLYSLNIEANSPLELADAVAGLLNVAGNVQLVTAVQRSRIAEAQKARAAQPVAEASTEATTEFSGSMPGDRPAAEATEAVAAEPVVPPKQPRRKKTDPVQPDPAPITLTAEPAPAAEVVKEQLTQSVADPVATPPLDRETVRKAVIAYGTAAQKTAGPGVSATDAMKAALETVFKEMVPPVTMMKDVPDDRLGELNALVAKHHAALTAA